LKSRSRWQVKLCGCWVLHFAPIFVIFQ